MQSATISHTDALDMIDAIDTLSIPPSPSPVEGYSDATAEILPLFRELVKKHHEIEQLGRYNIHFLFAHKPKKSKGKAVLGSCKTFPIKDKFLHDWDAQITLSLSFWEANPDARAALLFHELCHLEPDPETGILGTVSHDIEEFYATYRNYGDWLGELTRANVQQLELLIET
jgi:hypothetical protein